MCKTDDQAKLNGFTTYHRKRRMGKRAAGGVVTAVKIGVESDEIPVVSELEAIVTKIGPPLSCCILNIYLPPQDEISATDLINLINQIPKPLLIVGDINAHHPLWGSTHISRRGNILEEVIDKCELIILNSGDSTHINHAHGTFSSIDIACCSSELAGQLDWQTSESTHGSDHFPIWITFPGTSSIPQARTRWKIDCADWTLYQNSLQFQRHNCINQQIDHITDEIIRAAKIAIPRTKEKQGQKRVPWWNEEVAKAIRTRRKALRKLKRAGLTIESCKKEQLVKDFRKARTHARIVIQKAKQQRWIEFANNFNAKTPTKEMWNRFKRIQGKTTNSKIRAITTSNITVTEDVEIAETIATAFERISSESAYSEVFLQHKRKDEATELPTRDEFNADYNSEFQNGELAEALEGLKGSSPGEDNIHYAMITHLPPDCLSILLEAYNTLWRESVYPNKWTKSIVVPIYKGKGPRTDPSNYRPIYLNSCLGKIYERMINNRLIHFLESNNLLSKNQFAFRKGKSTTDHLASFDEVVRIALGKNHIAQAVFLDVHKAYDTCWRRLVLDRLLESGIRGRMLRNLENMLKKRTFRVTANGTLSSEKKMETGLCQGSVLSVTLFLVAINTITSCVPLNITCLLYADDLVLVASGVNAVEVEKQLQAVLRNIQTWQENTGFKISAEKSATIIFRNSWAKRPVNTDTLNINNTLITRTSVHKCLGVTFDELLNFKKHIEITRAACLQRIHFIHSVAKTNWGGDRATLIKLYRSTVLEKMIYAAPILLAVSTKNIRGLETVHNRGLKVVSGAFHTSPIVSIHAETGISNLRTWLEQRAAIYAVRVTAQRNESVFDEKRVIVENCSDISSESSRSSGDMWGEDAVSETETAVTRGIKEIVKLNIILPRITIFNRPSIAPWDRSNILSDISLTVPSQRGANPLELRRLFAEMNATKYRIHFKIFTDGSKTANRCGFSMIAENVIIKKRVNTMCSIYSAECHAVKEALLWVAKQERVGAYIICTDSLSLISSTRKQKIQNFWKNEIVKAYDVATRNGTEIVLVWVPSHIGIPGNEEADKYAKLALAENCVSDSSINFEDIKTQIKNKTREKWQEEWTALTENKLREVKNTILPYETTTGFSRKKSVVLTRLRIGHTIFSHAYLLEKESKPRCPYCNDHMTVKHIIALCPGLDNERRAVGMPDNLREALADDKERANKVLKFIKNIQLYSKI